MGSESALSAARRVQLIDRVNVRDQTIYRRVRTVTKELDAQRRALEADHRRQSDALEQLREQTDAMERKLALAQQQEQAAAQAAAAAATAQAVIALAAAPIETPATAPPAAPPPTVPVTTRPAPVQVAPAPPPSYVGNPGTHPMHNDPFLTCVRARESGGNYSVVNPAGPVPGCVSVPAGNMERDRESRRTERTRRCPPKRRDAVRPGRPRVVVVPVARCRPVGRQLPVTGVAAAQVACRV